MHIRNFFHFQTALKRHSVVDAAPDEKGVVGGREFRCEPLNALLVLEQALGLVGKGLQLCDIIFVFLLIDNAAFECQFNCNDVSDKHLCAVGFGCCHGNLRTSKCVKNMVGFAGDATAQNI